MPNADRWGQFKGRLLHTGYGKCAQCHVLIDKATFQGALVKLPLAFQSGILRPRFNQVDGQIVDLRSARLADHRRTRRLFPTRTLYRQTDDLERD